MYVFFVTILQSDAFLSAVLSDIIMKNTLIGKDEKMRKKEFCPIFLIFPCIFIQ